MYRALRAAHAAARMDEATLRAALGAPSAGAALAALAALDAPLSYARPFSGPAMAPLLNGGGAAARDTLVVRALRPAPRASPDRVFVGDVVVVEDPEEPVRRYVRRVAAMEGGEMVSEEDGDEPFRIPPEHCWVVRENAAAVDARDSTLFGPVALRHVVGRVMYAIRSSVDHGRVVSSRFAMATDEIVLQQELVAPHIDAHGLRVKSEAAAKREADARDAAAAAGKE